MVSGPGGRFRPEWLAMALPALIDCGTADQSPTVGLAVDEQVFLRQATHAGLQVARHDGRPLDAVVGADAAIVLGLVAGMLTLDDVRRVVDLEGDENALRALFAA